VAKVIRNSTPKANEILLVGLTQTPWVGFGRDANLAGFRVRRDPLTNSATSAGPLARFLLAAGRLASERRADLLYDPDADEHVVFVDRRPAGRKLQRQIEAG
jgi:hypothetical protein